MDPIDPLGTRLLYAGHQFELWLQRGEWFLYRSEFTGTSFRHFLIVRADREPRPDENEACYGLRGPVEDVNLCGPFFCNQWVARDKFMKLVKAETQSMRYRRQNRHQYDDRRVQVDLLALQRLSLADIFRALEGK
jgi:hypothetical protein